MSSQEDTKVYPTEDIAMIIERYSDGVEWCIPISGDDLAYYYREYDAWPVGKYLP